MPNVFHYSNTLKLPCIIETGELRPGLNRVSGLVPSNLEPAS